MMKHRIKQAIRKIPGAKSFAKKLGLAGRAVPIRYKYVRNSLAGLREEDYEIAQVKNMINYCKTTRSSDFDFDAGYHHVKIKSTELIGRRNPKARLEAIGFDFKDKVVLDIGCNQGAMVFALAGDVKQAIGLDYEGKVINVCNVIKKLNGYRNVDFYIFDIDADPHKNILDFIPESGVDVVFLLAVCKHVKKWRELIDFVAQLSPSVIFEANGSEEEKLEQANELKKRFKKCTEIYTTSPDDNTSRTMWLAENSAQ
jgi:2-polyprenyl-3-methyl-5-hydroxy-6-metoxy-1,4-benzoquinol methylase